MQTTTEPYYFGKYGPMILWNMMISGDLKNRELSALKNGKMIRYLWAFNLDSLSFIPKALKFSNLGLYHSVARIDNTRFMHRPIPLPWLEKFKQTEREKNAERDRVKKEFEKNITGYDWIIDIDSPKLEDAYHDTTRIYDFFKEQQVPFSINFSGGKGFHLRVNWSHIEEEARARLKGEKHYVKKVPGLCEHLTKSLITRLKLKFVDESIYTLQRVIRIPYSVHQNNNFVALPLSDSQFENFDAEMCRPERVLQMFPLKNRGNLERSGEFKLEKVL